MDAIEVLDGLKRQPILGAWIGRIDGLLGARIRQYLAGRASRRRAPAAKAVKDAVWGMIDLFPSELVVLDSPPLQRLRYVRQLGVTYLTYPTGGYSRYEHTLGAMHQAERMLRAIAARSLDGDALLENIAIVRLAALLHDIGHLPFSHVSERFYNERECSRTDYLAEMSGLKDEFAVSLPVPPPRLSECLSVAIALSPSFYDMLRSPDAAGYRDEQIAEAVLAIVGRPPSLSKAYLAQIITNVIDADKLDYMFRDAFATGVPLGVDLERLLSKLRCLSIPRKECRPSLQKIVDDEGPARVLGTDLAGLRHARDLALSRTMLFERVYHHHKTLAAERVVLAMLEHLALHPADLLLHDDRLFSPYGPLESDDRTRPLVLMLDRRELPHRTFAISYGFLTPLAPTDIHGQPKVPDEERDAWDLLDRTLKNLADRFALQDEIRFAAAAIGTADGAEFPDFRVWIDSPPEPVETPEVELVIARPDQSFAKGQLFASEAAAFARNPDAMSFVYVSGAGRAIFESTFVATERIFALKFGIFFDRLAADHAKISWKNVEQLKRKIERDDPAFFDGCRRLRPRATATRLGDGEARVEALSKRFAHYHTEPGVVVDARRIRAFVDQFPERLVEPMIRVLENATFLDRDALGREFSEVLRTGAPPSSVCVPLTEELAKSAAHLGYFLADHPEAPKVISLHEALKQDADITFFDDCLFSGTQARSTLQTWFGRPPELPDENLTIRLDNEQRARLTKHAVRFRFLYGTQHSVDDLKTLTIELGLGDDVVAVTQPVRDTRALDGILGEPRASDLRTFLGVVGQAVLTSTKGMQNPTKWTPERCAEFALGYGGMEQLLIFLYNTPTATITPLWKAGQFQDLKWLPLFPRRGETSPVVSRDA